MALLHLVVQQFGAGQVKALTVDHGLRAEAAAEAQQVGLWCAALKIPHHTLRWLGEKPETGIQAAARQARYNLMSAWCLANGISTLLTAHTANDQAETVVMRKRRTQSLRSTAGIWPKTDWNRVHVLRPLLHETRDDLRAYLQQVGQVWLDDPSNDNTKFERVRVRQELQLADVQQLANEASAAQRSVIAEDKAVKTWLSANGSMSETGVLTIPRLAFSILKQDLACSVLRWALWACGGGVSPPPDGVQRILDKARENTVTRMTLAGAMVAMRTKAILVGREPSRMSMDRTNIGPNGQVQWDNRFEISAPIGTVIEAAGTAKLWKHLLPHGLPAFAVAALPVLVLPNGQQFLPHFEATPKINVHLSGRLKIS